MYDIPPANMPGRKCHSTEDREKAAVVTLTEAGLSREHKCLLWNSSTLAATKTVNMWS